MRSPLPTDAFLASGSTCNRLVSLNDSRLIRAVFLQDVSVNTENWWSEIHDIFTEFGLEHSFNTLSKVDLNLFKDKLHKRNAKARKDTLIFQTEIQNIRTI